MANIRDGFEEGDLYARFNGNPAVVVDVAQVGEEDLLQIAEDVKAHVAEAQRNAPEGLTFTIWTDTSLELIDRLNALNSTAGGGLLLVLIILALFLRFRLAMWVAAGIPIALLGCTGTFPYVDINISTLTVIAFILVLGILVDDAIVVGERVHAHEQLGKGRVQAAVEGTWEVSIPVIFGVLTTMAAFLPLVLVEGRLGDFFGSIGYVVIIALVFSIIESQLILPAHLAQPQAGRGRPRLQPALEQTAGAHGGRPAGLGGAPLPALAAARHRPALRHRRHRRGGADPSLGAHRQRPGGVQLLPGH